MQPREVALHLLLEYASSGHGGDVARLTIEQ
jgi:hypothetical protein